MNREPARQHGAAPAIWATTDDDPPVEILGTLIDPPARDMARAPSAPRCPGHLSVEAAKEWRRVSRLLRDMGVLTEIDRAALAAYCQAYGRWVEAEEKLKETPILFKTPAGYVQQSPWLGISNKQLELMGRYMVELGMTPASRSRVIASAMPQGKQTAEAKAIAVLSDAELDAEITRLSRRLGKSPSD